MAGRRRGGAPKKPRNHEKRVNFQLIKPDSKDGTPIYQLMNRTIEQHHEHLTQARIVIAWNLAWKPDRDGVVKLGQLKKASDLDRELAPYDFVMLLRKEFWEHSQTTDEMRAALVDHELCHGSVALDSNLEPKRDERGRQIYRTRKHDIQEFSEIILRHGLWKRDLENAFIAIKTRQMVLEEATKTKRQEDEDGKVAKVASEKLQAERAATAH